MRKRAKESQNVDDYSILDKLHGVNMSSKTEVIDPITHQTIEKPMKPFVVNNAVHVIENHEIMIPEIEDEPRFLVGQLRGYIIKKRGVDGRPIYDGNDHILDAFCLALYGFHKQYTKLAKRAPDNLILKSEALTKHYQKYGSVSNRWPDPSKATKVLDMPEGSFGPVHPPAFQQKTAGYGKYNYAGSDSRARYMELDERNQADGVTSGLRQIGLQRRPNPIRRSFRAGNGSRRRSF
jgi:hypothetical protein